MLSLSDQCVVDLKIAAGGRNWRCVAAEILEALAPVLSKDHKPPQGETEALLRQRHRLASDGESDFQVNNPAAAMAAQRASTTTIAWLLAAIASVSLVVGGISIMNIMLVSVTERTREIGLRLAVGARRRDIRRQFLTEATTLCILGGLLGIALGTAASWCVAWLANWPIFLGADAALFAVAFAAAVGISFGYYPARKAAQLEPVEALRSE